MANALDRWARAGRGTATATVVATWGSAPCPVGSVLAVAAPDEPGGFPAFAGSVSGGCVEAAVVDGAVAVIAGAAPHTLRFGVSDEDAIAVGLACGGTIEVWIEACDERADRVAWRSAAWEGRAAARVVCLGRIDDERASGRPDSATAEILPPAVGDACTFVLDGSSPKATGSLGHPTLDAWASNVAADADVQGRPAVVVHGGRRFFIALEGRRERLILVGAGHVAQLLAPMAGAAGFDVVVVDPRAAFLDDERFPDTPYVHDWPSDDVLAEAGLDRRAYVVVLAHDPKIDDPALQAALAAGARYVGALGGASSHAARRRRLENAGLTTAAIERVQGPVGLAIGARTPAEIAIAIIAQLVAVRRGAA